MPMGDGEGRKGVGGWWDESLVDLDSDGVRDDG